MEKIIIFGTGQIAELAHYYLTNDSPFEIVAFTVDREYMDKKEFKGLPVVAFDESEQKYPPQEFKMFVPLSYVNINKLRAEKYYEAKRKGYSLISYVSSRATHFNARIGENCFILENTVIQPYASIGNNVILWSGSQIAHHTNIGDHCFLATNSVVSGSVVIHPYCFIGANATIRDNVIIGAHNVVGAGALILKDTPDYGVFKGNRTELSNLTSEQLRRI